MTGAVEAAGDYWFLILDCPVIRKEKAADNATCVAISRKTGMRLVGTRWRDFVCGQSMLARQWEMTRAEWRHGKPGTGLHEACQAVSASSCTAPVVASV